MIDHTMEKKKKFPSGIDPILLVRLLLITELGALLFSTSVTVIVEILIFICFLGFRTLRQLLFSALRQPMVVMALVLYLLVALGVLYSVAPFGESMRMWGSWRKLLVVPLAASVFNDFYWKQRLVVFFIVLATLAALVSFASFLGHFPIGKFPVGIVLQNHATQGMLFSVALFSCLVVLREPLVRTIFPRWLLIIFSSVLLLNIIFVTPGRSGYLALIVLVIMFLFFTVHGRSKGVIMLLSAASIALLLVISPTAKKRIIKAYNEISTYSTSAVETSLGVRIIMWKNTIALLQKNTHPAFGYGTGGFTTAYEQQVAGQKGWQGKPVGDPHNQYLRVLVEYGIIGGLVFLGFILAFFRQQVPENFYILGISVLLAWCATSMFSAHFTTFTEGRFLMIWCGALLSSCPVLKEDDDQVFAKDIL